MSTGCTASISLYWLVWALQLCFMGAALWALMAKQIHNYRVRASWARGCWAAAADLPLTSPAGHWPGRPSSSWRAPPQSQPPTIAEPH